MRLARAVPLWLFVAAPLAAQADGRPAASPSLPRFPRGEVTEIVRARTDPEQRYAVYLPSRYTPERRWPLLLLMDPRGRALTPLRLVRESAERLGYVVLSSYNTRSDVVIDPNRDALNAMLVEAQRDYSLDERRIYLVGFSGTARAGWEFGLELAGHVAGVIGVGAGLPLGARTPAPPGPGGPSFAYFGGAGTTDYNYDELQRLDGELDKVHWPHRIVAYPGPHAWPSASVLAQALGWMELQAMRTGLLPVDRRVVDSMYAGEMRAARVLEADGHLLDALLRYRSVASDFAGVHDTPGVAADTLRLRSTPQVRAERSRRLEIEQRQFAHAARVAVYCAELRRGTRRPEPLERALKHLDIPDTQRLAAARGDSAESLAARRRLIHLLTIAGYREPPEGGVPNDSAGVRALLEIAEAVRRGAAGN